MKNVFAARQQGPTPHFAVLDWDNTCIKGDCAEATLAYMARSGYPHAREDFEHYYQLLDAKKTKDAYRFGAGTLRGLSVQEVDTLVRKVMEFEGTEITNDSLFGRTIARGIAFRERIGELIEQVRAAKIAVWIVSASPAIVVRSTMKYFGIEAGLIGVRNVIRDGLITQDLIEPLSIYEGKVECIKELINPTVRPLFGIGDSMNDLPMIEYARVRAVVDRGNELAAKARESGWHII